MPITIDIYPDTRYFRKKTKDFGIKLRVHAEEPRLYTTIYGLTAAEIEALPNKRASERVQAVRKKLEDLKKRAIDAADALLPFDFDEFERDFIKNNPEIEQLKLKVRKKPVLPADIDFDTTEYERRFPILLKEFPGDTIGFVFKSIVRTKLILGKISTASNYQSAFISLEKFGGNKPFRKITPMYLHQYSEWMKGNGNSKTTTGMYLRNLRAAFHEADDLKINKKSQHYPFGPKKFKIPGTRNIKKTYEVDDVQKLYGYQCDTARPWLQRAKDFALLILFGNGLNPLDICLLKRKNVTEQFIEFERAKTAETAKEDPPKIVIWLNEDIRQIIERNCSRDVQGQQITDPESYLFPIFEPGISPLEEYKRRQVFIEFINQWLTFIFQELGVNKKGRTYDLRHTFATLQRMGGASIDDIQEYLGQADPRTTKRYVASLPIEQKRIASERMDIVKAISA